MFAIVEVRYILTLLIIFPLFIERLNANVLPASEAIIFSHFKAPLRSVCFNGFLSTHEEQILCGFAHVYGS
uniref:Secreted protein n=1 Tax=Parascaris univalens TaxID=6257 RepID=A0A915AF34_PARUN